MRKGTKRKAIGGSSERKFPDSFLQWGRPVPNEDGSTMKAIPISPLSLNQLTRDYWGQYDPAIIAQLAALANDPCYQIKFYKAPSDDQELVDAYGYASYGIRITPGSIIFGFYLPCIPNVTTPTASKPGAFTVQITDVSLEHKFWDQPVSSLMLANFKPTYQTAIAGASPPAGYLNMGSFPNLLVAPHPVVGSGQFDIEIQNTAVDGNGVAVQQRIELVIGVLEVCGVS
jgi:hypothetical protein